MTASPTRLPHHATTRTRPEENPMTDPTAEDETEARTAWLLSLSVDQITRFDAATICDWLAARNEQHCARLRAACKTLRELNGRRERAHVRLVALLTPQAAAEESTGAAR